MMAMKQALTGLWRNREKVDRSYLLINDVRGYFADASEVVSIDGTTIPVHVCANEFALRSCSEEERNSGKTTPKIIVSRKQLQPDHVPDLQTRSSISARTVTGCDVAKALGVTNPRALLDRLPVNAFWNLAPYLPQLESYSLERVILASLLNDTEILSSGWSADRILDKLWYEDALPHLRRISGQHKTAVGPADVTVISPATDYGLPSALDAVEVPFGYDSYGWPGKVQDSTGNPHNVQGNDHGGLTPEETVVPVAIYVTRGV